MARRHAPDAGSAPAPVFVATPVGAPDLGADPRVVLDRGRGQGLIVAAALIERVLDRHPSGSDIPEPEVRSLYFALLEAADRYDPDTE